MAFSEYINFNRQGISSDDTKGAHISIPHEMNFEKLQQFPMYVVRCQMKIVCADNNIDMLDR